MRHLFKIKRNSGETFDKTFQEIYPDSKKSPDSADRGKSNKVPKSIKVLNPLLVIEEAER